MEHQVSKVSAPGRKEVELLGATFEKGSPDDVKLGNWRQKLETRDERLKYLQSAERYLHSTEWYGSERRKNPA